MIFYYSGCGNSKFIAQSIAEAFDEKMAEERLKNYQIR